MGGYSLHVGRASSPLRRRPAYPASGLGATLLFQPIRTVAGTSQIPPALRAENPIGKIPAPMLADKGALYDGFVMIDHLDTGVGGGRVSPRDAAARLPALRRRALASGVLDLLVPWRNKREKPHLRRAWLDGIAQITAAIDRPFMDFRFRHLGWRPGCPLLAAWEHGFVARPSMRATVF